MRFRRSRCSWATTAGVFIWYLLDIEQKCGKWNYLFRLTPDNKASTRAMASSARPDMKSMKNAYQDPNHLKGSKLIIIDPKPRIVRIILATRKRSIVCGFIACFLLFHPHYARQGILSTMRRDRSNASNLWSFAAWQASVYILRIPLLLPRSPVSL